MGRNFLAGVIAFVMIGWFLSYFGFFGQGISQTAFAPTDRFEIPVNNSSILFAFAGIYEQASLENGVWSFVNLQFNGFRSQEKVSFKVSAVDSTVNITACAIYNSTFAGESAKGAILRYHVAGQGTQVFDLGLDAERGDWSVILNDEWLGKDHGWSLSSDGTLTVTEATGTVILAYFGFPSSFGESGDGFSQPFLDQHFVIVTTMIVTVIIALLAVAIRTKNKGLK